MIDLELFSSENEDQKQCIRVFSEDNEVLLSVPFSDSITVNQLIIEVMGSEDDNMFVTKKGSSLVLRGEITTSTDVTSRLSGLLFIIVYMHSDNPTILLSITDNSAKSSSHFSMEFLQSVTGSEIIKLFGHSRDDVKLCKENGETLDLDESVWSQGVVNEDRLLSKEFDR